MGRATGRALWKDWRLLMLPAVVVLASGGVVRGATLVDTPIDESDGSCLDGDCSLRDALAAASPGDTINLPADVYTLTLGSALIVNTGRPSCRRRSRYHYHRSERQPRRS